MKNLNAVGRYVQIKAVANKGSYIFVDEIEVKKANGISRELSEYIIEKNKIKRKYSNLAFGKKYTWSKAPNYSLTNNANDNMKLSDGKHADENAQTIWSDKNACVGWAANELEIVFDLEKIEPVDAIYYSTQVFPRANVFLPTIVVGASNDGTKFKQVAVWTPADITQSSDDSFRYAISIKNLKAVGRYIKLVIVNAKGWYVFTDEIEIIGGGFKMSSVNMDNFPDMDTSAKGIRKMLASRIYVANIKNYAKSLLNIVKENKNRSIAKESSEFAEEVGKICFLNKKDYENIYPKYCAIIGKINKAKFKDNFIVWNKNPWVKYQRHEAPGRNYRMMKPLSSSMMINEYESLSFMLTNTTGQNAVYNVIVDYPKCA